MLWFLIFLFWLSYMIFPYVLHIFKKFLVLLNFYEVFITK